MAPPPIWVSLVAQMVKMQETWVPSLGWEDPRRRGWLSTHSSILAWKISGTEEEPGGLHGFEKSQTLLKRLSTHPPMHARIVRVKTLPAITALAACQKLGFDVFPLSLSLTSSHLPYEFFFDPWVT